MGDKTRNNRVTLAYNDKEIKAVDKLSDLKSVPRAEMLRNITNDYVRRELKMYPKGGKDE